MIYKEVIYMRNKNVLKKYTEMRIGDMISRLSVNNDIKIKVFIEEESGQINSGVKLADDKNYNYVMAPNIANINRVDDFVFTMFEGTAPENEIAREEFYKKVSWDFNLSLYTEECKRIWSKIIDCLCIDYITLHECGHILNGHLELNRDKKLDDLDRKTLEMDADAFSINRLWEILNSEGMKNLNIVLNKQHALWLGFIAITIVNSLNGMGNKNINQYSNYYLPKKLRWYIDLVTLYQLYRDIDSIYPSVDYIEIDDIFIGATTIEEAVYNYMIACGVSEDDLNINNFSSDISKVDEYNTLCLHWKNHIRSQLMPYSKIDLAE